MEEQIGNINDKFLATNSGKTKSNAIEVPAISLPAGGGAIKGIDEKFAVNAINGTSTFTIPLPFSQARGLNPDLKLSYNSGSGNCVFGLGWSLSLSSIKRKTDKELPQYNDAIDSDTFILSDAEDLVPELQKEIDGSFTKDADDNYIIHEKDSVDGFYRIRFYKPRIEGLFARIERWTHKTSYEIKWRVITGENVTTLYGWSSQSRLADPKDERRIFEWMPEFVFDDKGNCARYIYKKEDKEGSDQSLLHNRNRFENDDITYTRLYIEKVFYGNKTPYKNFGDPVPDETDFLFETIFDYGEYNPTAPYNKINQWDYRKDAFSIYKPGFEIRTTRLCKRVLLFHFFNELPGGSALVKSLDFEYDDSGEENFTFLRSLTACGYIKQADGTYTQKKLPAAEFIYQAHEWNKEISSVSPGDLINAPSGLDEPSYQFTDLFNEGLSGILTEQANGWYYKHNLGQGRFEAAKLVTPKPSFQGLGGSLQLVDLDADGGKQLANYYIEPKGFFELDDAGEWQPFTNFDNLPNLDIRNSNTRMLDLNGDGMPDMLITEDNVFTWYESAGRKGFLDKGHAAKSFDEEKGPAVIFADTSQSIFLADMSGGGMTDIVRIRNKDICYWPNLGYGKFGARVSMDNSPVFDSPDLFDPSFLRLADIDGSGTTDIIYLGRNKFSCWKNLSGNSFAAIPFEIDPFVEVNNHVKITVTDLLGTGVACITWSSNLFKDSNAPLKYIDLLKSKKPHILTGYKNNMGKEVSLEYTPSTQFYIEDKLAGTPWVTRLHFPVHCISKMETKDTISGCGFISSYKYHHGYFDHAEREFRGFGMVEQTDSESFENWAKDDANNIIDKTLYQQPVLTRSWVHTGAMINRDDILTMFENGYWYNEMKRQGFAVVTDEVQLPDAKIVAAPGIDATLADQLSAVEYREAFRACKGMTLRTEIFALDAPLINATTDELQNQLKPYSVGTHNCVIELLQPKGPNKFAIFVVKESEVISYSYDRNIDEPRVAHNVNIKLDEYGHILESASIVYPKKTIDASLPVEVQDAQNKILITYVESSYTNDVNTTNDYRIRQTAEMKTYELKAIHKSGPLYTPDDFTNILTASTGVDYHVSDNSPVTPQRRLIEHSRILYLRDDCSGPLPSGVLESKGLSFENYLLAYTPDLLTDIFDARVDDTIMLKGKFIHTEGDNNWWIRSGSKQFIAGAETFMDAQNRFYVPVSVTDSYGAKTKLRYFSNYFLFVDETEDELHNKSQVLSFNMQTLSPRRIMDANDNIVETLLDELGMPKAMALFGKGNEADDLTGINEFSSAAEDLLIENYFNATDSIQLTSIGKDLLQHASVRFVYDLDIYKKSGGKKPAVVSSIVREEHFQKNNNSPVILSFEYSNGMEQVAMKKVQAEPGLAKKVILNPDDTYTVIDVDTAALLPAQLRWIGNGRTVMNNKGKVVKQYEPYFSITHQYEDLKELVETGVSPLLYYDPLGRLMKTEFPDETFAKTVFDPWKKSFYDQNDSVLASSWYNKRINHLIDAQLIADGKDPAKEKSAAEKAAIHANTPGVYHFDVLGRPVLMTENNGKDQASTDILYKNINELDIEGNSRKLIDDMKNAVMQYKYDMLGNMVYENSMDAGQRWLLQDILGNALYTWDERDHILLFEYDILHRPLTKKVQGGDGPLPLDNVVEKIVYGEGLPNAKAKNFLAKAVVMYDTAGKMENLLFDFKGDAVSTKRTFSLNYKDTVDWNSANPDNKLDQESFTTSYEFDALKRIKSQTTPDLTVFTPLYNEAGLLETVQVTQKGVTKFFVKNIDYTEKGNRKKITYGNDVITNYFYDKANFRLLRLETKRQNNDALQDLYFTYDPVGNITYIEDKDIPVVFFNNQKIDGVSSYTYDALYRLTEATGREHAGQNSFGLQDNWSDLPFMKQYSQNDLLAWRNYTQQYQYDSVGNISQMHHIAPGGDWNRDYSYETVNNRLKSTTVNSSGNTFTYDYVHHPKHGFITSLPHLHVLKWNFKEELQAVAQTSMQSGTPETTYYVYDGSGQRARKITERQAGAGVLNPAKKSQRIYLGGCEIYREYDNVDALAFERQTFHVMDDKRRIAMIETRTFGMDDGRERLIRYQFGNHLGSASIETDENAVVISYEEFHPFGTTSYQAMDKDLNAAYKRYRFAGMERDDESGFEYHGARYYMSWLGRWLNADPSGIKGGINLYRYCSNNPVSHIDSSGKADKTIHQYQTEQLGQEFTDKENARKIGRAVNASDRISELDATDNSMSIFEEGLGNIPIVGIFFRNANKYESKVNLEKHALGGDKPEVLRKNLTEKLKTEKFEGLTSDQALLKFGVEYAHPFDDSFFHTPTYTQGTWIGHFFTPEADLPAHHMTKEEYIGFWREKEEFFKVAAKNPALKQFFTKGQIPPKTDEQIGAQYDKYKKLEDEAHIFAKGLAVGIATGAVFIAGGIAVGFAVAAKIGTGKGVGVGIAIGVVGVLLGIIFSVLLRKAERNKVIKKENEKIMEEMGISEDDKNYSSGASATRPIKDVCGAGATVQNYVTKCMGVLYTD